MSLQTEFEFILPKGYVDAEGTLHRHGVMRLATARDEIEPLRDPRVAHNEAYLTIIVLARVITELGALEQVNTTVIEGLFATDLAYLQDFYGIINFGEPEMLEALESEGGQPEQPTPTDDGGSNGAAPKKQASRRPSGTTTKARARASR